jgi:hypothetical protein
MTPAPWKMITRLLWWKSEEFPGLYEAVLGDFKGGDGVRFSLEQRPSCYRRGQWKLLIEVCGGPNHFKWGCFDEADQPQRNYHIIGCALQEADAIAGVLEKDRGTRCL